MDRSGAHMTVDGRSTAPVLDIAIAVPIRIPASTSTSSTLAALQQEHHQEWDDGGAASCVDRESVGARSRWLATTL